MTIATHTLPNGGTLQFHVLQYDGATWNDVAGVYMFCQLASGQYIPHYIGQAVSFKDRLPSHERWKESARYGATFVLAIAVPTQAQRDSIERQLIQQLRPGLNDHHT